MDAAFSLRSETECPLLAESDWSESDKDRCICRKANNWSVAIKNANNG